MSSGLTSAEIARRGGLSYEHASILSNPIDWTEDLVEGLAKGAAKTVGGVGLASAKFGASIMDYGAEKLGAYDTGYYEKDYFSKDLAENTDEMFELMGFTSDKDRESGITSMAKEVMPYVSTFGGAFGKLMGTRALTALSAKSTLAANVTGMAAVEVGQSLVYSNKDDASLSQLAVKHGYDNELFAFLADRDEDDGISWRLKAAIENGALGLAGEGVFTGLKFIKAKIWKDSKTMKEVVKKMDEVVGTGDGSVAESFLKKETVLGAIMQDEMALKGLKSETGTLNGEIRRLRRNKQKARQKKKNAAKADELEKRLMEVQESIYKLTEKNSRRHDLVKELSQRGDLPKAAEDLLLTPNKLSEGVEEIAEDLVAASPKSADDLTERLVNPNHKISKKRVEKSTREIERNNMMNDLLNGTSPIKHADAKTLEKFLKYAAENQFDEKTVIETAEALGEILGDVNQVMLQMMEYRSAHTVDVKAFAKELTTKLDEGIPLAKQKHTMAKFMNKLAKLTSHDGGIQGMASGAGRILQTMTNQVSQGSSFLELFEKGVGIGRMSREINLVTKNSVKGVPKEMRAYEYAAQLIDEGRTKSLEKFLRRINGEDVLDNKTLKRLTKEDTLLDVWATQFLAGLFDVSTIAGSVLMNNAFTTMWKQTVDPLFTGLLSQASRNTGSTGASIADSAIGAKVLMTKTFETLRGLMQGKKLNELMTITDQFRREGTEKGMMTMGVREQYNNIKAIAEAYAANGHAVKATIADIIAGPMALAMKPGSMVVNAMGKIDEFFKGLNYAAGVEIAAERAWRQTGGAEVLEEANKEIFMKKYRAHIKAIADISKDASSKADKTLKMTEYFKNLGLSEDHVPMVMEQVVNSFESVRQVALEAGLMQETRGTILGDALEGITTKMEKTAKGRVLATLVVPFRKTPINMVHEMLSYSPASFFLRRTRETLSNPNATPLEKFEIYAKMVAGLSATMSIGYLVHSKQITGAFTSAERVRMEALGIPEHSVLIGGRWYSHKKLGILSMFISSTAEALNVEDGDDTLRSSTESSGYLGKGLEMASGFVSRTTQMTSAAIALAATEGHLGTLKEMLELMESDNKGEDIPKWFIRVGAKGTVPAASTFKTFKNLTDTKKYSADTEAEASFLVKAFGKAVQNDQALRPVAELMGMRFRQDVDALGQPKQFVDPTPASVLGNIFGFKNRDAKMSHGIMALQEAGLVSNQDSSMTISGFKLTPSEVKKMNEKIYGAMGTGKTLMEIVDDLASTPYYQTASKADRIAMVTELVEDKKKYVKTLFEATSGRMQSENMLRHIKEIRDNTREAEDPNAGSQKWYMDKRKQIQQSDFYNHIEQEKLKEDQKRLEEWLHGED